MAKDAPSDKLNIAGEDVAAIAKTLLSEARKHPKTAAAIGIGIGAVAAAVLFMNRKADTQQPKAPKVPKGIQPESD